MNRRNFLKTSGIAGAAGVIAPSLAMASDKEIGFTANLQRPKVIFFDVNETLLDLSPMKISVGKVLNGRVELLPLWFTTMLQYSLVATVTNQYFDFGAIGAAALQMVGASNGITVSVDEAKTAIKPILSLPAHADVKESLVALRKAGYKLVSFTNSSAKAVAAQLNNSGLAALFDEQLSIEEIGKFKPHADAYSWAARKMGLLPAECMLVAAHGWDVAGAKYAGWQTVFLSRPGQQLFPLATPPDIVLPDLKGLPGKLV